MAIRVAWMGVGILCLVTACGEDDPVSPGDTTPGPGEFQLTSDAGMDQRPTWAADDFTIAFDSDRSGNPDLWMVPSAGGAVAQHTINQLLDRDPDWSPDGTQIVYSSRNGGSADPELWLIPIGGGMPVLLVADVGPEDRFPAWSPTGSHVAFDKAGDIYVVPGSGGAPIQLTTDPANDLHPTWSPDGLQIAFVSNRSGNDDIWVIPSAGGVPVQVTTNPATDGAPDWSPSGGNIAFHSNRSGNNDIWVIPTGGGTAAQLTTDPGIDVQPAWSTAGGRIAFARDGNIWIYRLIDIATAGMTDLSIHDMPGGG